MSSMCALSRHLPFHLLCGPNFVNWEEGILTKKKVATVTLIATKLIAV